MTGDAHVVVVLNWNGREDTLACVASIIEDGPGVSVLVVDNGSFDGTVEAVAARWPDVHTLQLEQNTGFTGGMNSGIRHGLDELAADTVTILNNDTIVRGGALARLRDVAATGAAVCPEIRYLAEPERVWFGGGALDRRDGYPHHIAADALSACDDGLRSSEMLTGCCITATADVWRRVGLFDERFFLNFEDSEWSLRAAAAGVPLVVACDAVILHAVSASFRGAAATLGSYYYLRNGLLFSRLAGVGAGARHRFLRRFGFVGMRRSGWRERTRLARVTAQAVFDYARGRYGTAPPGFAGRVASWAGTPRGE